MSAKFCDYDGYTLAKGDAVWFSGQGYASRLIPGWDRGFRLSESDRDVASVVMLESIDYGRGKIMNKVKCIWITGSLLGKYFFTTTDYLIKIKRPQGPRK